jgi:hypothetical protein
MDGHLPERDLADVEALASDRYLDALLAAASPADASGTDGTDPSSDTDLDPALRDAARLLRRSLIRVHPSFRFEEALAGRLAGMTASTPGRAIAWGELIPFGPVAARPEDGPMAVRPDHDAAAIRPARGPAGEPPDELGQPDPWLAAILAGALDPTSDLIPGELLQTADSRLGAARRPLLIGGAITSAALSLAGVAWVAWRVARTSPIGEIEGTA